MSEPFLSEIKIVSFNFPPKGWALCNGQFLPINQNQALFALLGTTYGGNGQTTFALPNLRGRVPIHVGSGHTLGEAAGSTTVTINIQQLPTHLHTLQASTNNGVVGHDARQPASSLERRATSTGRRRNLVAMAPESVTSVGGQPAAQQHDALPGAELYHRAAGHLPVAELEGGRR